MLTLRVMLRANTDRIAVLAAAVAVGALAGVALLYLTLVFTPDRSVDF
jgi:hypothetical protein